MNENKVDVLSEFFKKYIFYTEKVQDMAWVDGAYALVAGAIKEELCEKTINEIIEYFTISGDKNSLDSYKKFDNFIKYNNDFINGILNTSAQQTKLSYLQILTEYLEAYKQNRNPEIESVYNFCAKNEIDTITISFAGKNLGAIESIFNSLPTEMELGEKLKNLRVELNKLDK